MAATTRKSLPGTELQVSPAGRPRKSDAERTVPVTISVPGAVLATARRRAEEEGLNFSAFAARAIARDIGVAA